ncbi:hypothetical protein KXD40_000687 [Peronospora effusa]|uniref:Protein kinase domain-containing protein n=1 Tax=Peronospora effusa TaxID=542832 RepID=A0A3M6V9B4_9STRA|nr:hypothetical protein DD238_007578 [Peronospora effusa]RQM12759.1 hypothetical protein DD237_007111 [Peronospora effusa]UIZ20880.1 hypothetical protein KXD40_000687 [Peronospora effusa]CAI5723650.1 unnamed protein product [Peronospora effusa]
MDVGYFMVNVKVERLKLELKSSSVENMTFMSLAMSSVELMIQNVTTDIHIINSTMTDLSLPLRGKALTEIELNGTTVTKLPKFLYERDLGSNMDITVDLSSLKGETELSGEQLTLLEANAQTLSTQSWAQEYHSNCESVDILSMTVSVGSRKRTVLCGSRSSSATSATRSHAFTNSDRPELGDAGSNDNVTSSGLSTGALAAIIVVVVVIAMTLGFLLFRMYKKRKAANSSSQKNEATATLMSKSDVDKGSFISNDVFLRNFRLPQSTVALVKSVGTGRLWMGEYNGGKVVVKRVESEVTDSHVTKALMAQARTFATISHPNITNLVGVTWLAGTDFAVVTEFMGKSNLKTVLTNKDVGLDVRTKLQMCNDVALALAYLHETEQNMCAKQLSSRKVLVNKNMECKLSLFECVPSSAKTGGPSSAVQYSYGMGELVWLPPEVITRSSPMNARTNNIYAFGVLISEIFTRASPYQSLIEEMGNTMSDVELAKRVRRQDPLEPHENRQEYLAAPAIVRQLVEQCLSYAPLSRPTAKEIVDILHHAKEELATDSI